MKKLIQGFALLTLASTMMGNTTCQTQAPAARELRRRVQMGQVVAPKINLPSGSSFDFQYVANAQMYDILTQTQAFSTATVDPTKIYDPSGLNRDEAAVFNQCGDNTDQATSVLGKIMAKGSTISQSAACMIDMPQGVVSGNILDFTLTSKAGVSLSLANVAFLPSASFTFQQSTLSLTMKVMSPLEKGGDAAGDTRVIATTSQDAFSNDWGADLQLSFGGFSLGPSYYYNSPLSKVTSSGLTSGIDNLKTSWDAAEPWYAMVLRNCDKYIYINAGNASDAGLQVGDLVKIQNVDYRWSADACASDLMGTVDYIGGPVAYATVISVGDNMSAAQIIDNDPNYPYSPDQLILPGARVYMQKLFVPATTGTTSN